MPKAPHAFLSRLGIEVPIIQAPMAGVSTPAMAAAVSNAGALGSIAVGAVRADEAQAMITAVRQQTARPFNVNVFCHQPALYDPVVERAWIDRLRPEFEALGAEPPVALSEIYQSFVEDDEMFELLLEERPAVVSFHFGLPRQAWIRALQARGITLLASVTSLSEAQTAAAAGIDALVAQGWEAGGHRGVFDPAANDAQLGTLAVTRLLVRRLELPVVAAGGIMDGAGIAAVLRLGAAAAQLGTAFVGADESLADRGYREALTSEAAYQTVMTRVISGRPARSLANRFTRLGRGVTPESVPSYPMAYDLGKALHAAGKARDEFGFGAQWAGQGAPLLRQLPAGKLVDILASELADALT